MSIPTFKVSPADIIALLPIDASEITGDSSLSTADIDEMILDKAAMLCGLLTKSGVGYEDLDAITERQCGMYVKNATVADCLDALGANGPNYSHYRREANEIYRLFGARPQVLNKRVTRALTNSEEQPPPGRDFVGTGYRF